MSEIIKYINIPPARIVGMAIFVAVMLAFIIWVAGFRKKTREIIQNRNYFFAISAVLIVISIGALIIQKPKWGLDFTGGTVLNLAVKPNVTAKDIREAVAKFSQLPAVKNKGDFSNPKVQMSLEVIKKESSSEIDSKVSDSMPLASPIVSPTPETKEKNDVKPIVDASPKTNTKVDASPESSPKTEEKKESAPKLKTEESNKGLASVNNLKEFRQCFIQVKQIESEQASKLVKFLQKELGGLEVLKIETIGPTIGNELKKKAIIALLLALLAQLFYITFRFGSQFRYGLSADIALIHDLIIMVGIYTLLGKPFNSSFVAALLTIIGYSVMDSVVVFDRVRENLKLMKGKNYESTVNLSLNQVVTRTSATSFTTILTLFAIYYFGGETLQNFSLALLIGAVVGTYSSFFVASPLVVMIDNFKKEGERKRVEERRSRLEAEAEEKKAKKEKTVSEKDKDTQNIKDVEGSASESKTKTKEKKKGSRKRRR